MVPPRCRWLLTPSSPTGRSPTTPRGSARSFLGRVWEQLGRLHVPARESVFRRAGHNPTSSRVAADLVFLIPETVITTDAGTFLDFHDRHDSRIVTKPWAS